MGAWKRFWNLSRRDRRMILEAAVVVVASRVGLRLAGYRRWKSFVGRSSSLQASGAGSCARDHLVRMADAAARNLFFRATCLERSFGLWWLLRSRGFDAEIQIGGRRAGDRFEAHAWVECASNPADDANGEEPSFAVFRDAGAARQSQ